MILYPENGSFGKSNILRLSIKKKYISKRDLYVSMNPLKIKKSKIFIFGYSVFVCPDLKKRCPDVVAFTLKKKNTNYCFY